MEATLQKAGQQALDVMRKQGVEGEAFVLYAKELGIELTGGKVETLKEAEQIGMGIRIMHKGRLGFSYTSDFSDFAVREGVENAIRISAYTTPDEYHHLPDPVKNYPSVNTFDPMVEKISVEQKIQMAREVEEIAVAKDARICVVERAGYEDAIYSNLIMNTKGLYAYGKGSYCGLYIFLVAREDEDAQNGFSTMIKRKISDLIPGQVGEEAAHKALRSLKARTISSGNLPCIMEPQVAARFLSLIGQTVEADSVQKGKSMFAGKIGEKVASTAVNIVDDALHEQGIGSFPFDAEGVISTKKPVISEGILNGFLYDTHCGLKEGKASTGNAQRGSFRSLPSVGTTNFILELGTESPDKLQRQISKGLYITDVMGMHTANPISGNFSVGASGIMIENGVLTYPVRGITIAGNLVQLFKDVDAVGNDVRFFGSKATPSLLLNHLSIGGE
ncbi:MAG: TldD/PmbA family protein [Bacillota bacterium]|nr:TldD/PmbA family protein [Bacillota bacterium]